jgi:hypothetical protein
MAALESAKHELFVQKWHELDNKSEAYRQSHPASLRWKEATVNSKASVLSKQDKILARYKELQEKTSKRHGITIDSLLKELDEIKQLSMGLETPQCSAAVSSVMSKAKLTGHDIIRVEVTEKEELTPWSSILAEADK